MKASSTDSCTTCIVGGQSPRRLFHTNSAILLIFLASSHLKSLRWCYAVVQQYRQYIQTLSITDYFQKTYTPFLGGPPSPAPAGGCLVRCPHREPDPKAREGAGAARLHPALCRRCGNAATRTKHPLSCCFPRLLAHGDKDLRSLVTAGALSTHLNIIAG